MRFHHGISENADPTKIPQRNKPKTHANNRRHQDNSNPHLREGRGALLQPRPADAERGLRTARQHLDVRAMSPRRNQTVGASFRCVLFVRVCGEVTATRGDARGCPKRETWTRPPLRNNPLCPAELPDGNSVDSRRATLHKATQHAVGPGRPAVASLLRARRRFKASASPRSPGRFRAPRQPNAPGYAARSRGERRVCAPSPFAAVPPSTARGSAGRHQRSWPDRTLKPKWLEQQSSGSTAAEYPPRPRSPSLASLTRG